MGLVASLCAAAADRTRSVSSRTEALRRESDRIRTNVSNGGKFCDRLCVGVCASGAGKVRVDVKRGGADMRLRFRYCFSTARRLNVGVQFVHTVRIDLTSF